MLISIAIGCSLALGVPVDIQPTVSPVALRLHAPWLARPVAIRVSALRTDHDLARPDGTEDTEKPDASTVVEGLAPGTLQMSLAPGSWILETMAEGAWAPAIEIDIEEGKASELDVALLPAGDVVSTISVDAASAALPHSMTARWSFRGEAPAWLAPGPYEQRCPVEAETHKLLCTLPARAIDLRLGAPGFVPHYAWGLEVVAGQQAQLPNLVLRTGSSLVGRVERSDGDPAQGASVQAAPARAGGAPTATTERRSEQLKEETSVNALGFFQIAALRPGAYNVTVELAGYGRVTSSLIKVRAESEVVLDQPLVLHRFPKGEIAITPLIDPSGAPWTVILADSRGGTQYTQTDDTGLATFPMLEPGVYQAMVMTADGESLAHREVTLSEDRSRVEIAIDSIEVEGSVTLADQPLAARLYFGGSHGAESVHLRSDADGRFAGTLPRLGSWVVDIISRAEWVERRGVRIEVEPAEEGPAQIEIALPAAAIEGRVIDDSGEGVADAAILVVALGVAVDPPSPRSRGDGHFTLRGVDPGRYRLQAFKVEAEGRATSASVEVEIDAPAAIAEVELVLGDRSTQRGVVLDPYGRGVPGAAVEVNLPPGASVILPRTTTDADGSFVLHLPPEQSEAEILVMAPGYRLHEERLPVASSREWVLVLDENAGVLHVVGVQPQSGTMAMVDRVAPDPRSYPLHLLRRWASIQRSEPADPNTLLIPGMPAGTYRICPPPSAHRAAECISTSLSIGSEATLTMPDVPPGEPGKENER